MPCGSLWITLSRDARKSAATTVYLPLCFRALDPSSLSAVELLEKVSAQLSMPSATLEDKIVTTNKKKGLLQRLKQDLERKYDGFSLQISSWFLVTQEANTAAQQ